MPTGYTASVADGTVTDLKTYVMTAARGLGALVMMRDEPFNAPIPQAFEPSPYYADRVKETGEEIRRIETMNEQERQTLYEEAQAEWQTRYDKALATHTEQRERYLNMIVKVKSWTGAPEGLKEFALSQLKESIKFDCKEPFKYWPRAPLGGADAYSSEHLDYLRKDLVHLRKYQAEEEQRINGRNEWLAQLHKSLENIND